MIEKYCLRMAEWKDKDLLYDWRNDSSVRLASFQTEIIPVQEHEKWFREKLKDDGCSIYILEIDGKAAGQIRIDQKDKMAYISYSISIDYRGRGYGKLLLQLLEKELHGKGLIFVGQVKKDNIASQIIFQSRGYEKFEKENFFEYRKCSMGMEYGNGETETLCYRRNERKS